MLDFHIENSKIGPYKFIHNYFLKYVVDGWQVF